MADIPEAVRREHMAVCEKCPIHKGYAKKFDIHFDWIDCPFVCKNDYETWKKEREDG